MRSAIMTRISNNGDANVKLDFGSAGRFMVPAHSKDIEIPADVWGIADYRRRAYLSSNIASGALEVTLLVISTNGAYVEVPFMPHLVGAAPAVVSSKVSVEPAKIETPKADKETHTIVADSGAAEDVAKSMGLESEDVMATAGADDVEQKGVMDSTTGFTDLGTPTAVEATPVAAEGVTVGTEASTADTFAQYVADKQWDQAAAIVSQETGSEVSAASLKALKDKSYDAVIAHYSKN